MILFPNAKINIGLNVVSKREDGYHNINTVFLPVGKLFDILEVIPLLNGSEKDVLTVSGLDVPCISEDNLCLKAVNLMRQYIEIPPLNIFLHKIIPFGAGLGGGSSDAAFMLKLLNEMYQADFDVTKLEIIASKIGADCPFFIKNQATYAEGTGNIFSLLDSELPNLWLELIVPQVHVSTAFAYKTIIPCTPKNELKTAVFQPIDTWKKNIINDFEKPVFTEFPELKKIKEKLYEKGALYASMSGSGSSVFGLFHQNPKLIWNKSLFVYSGFLR